MAPAVSLRLARVTVLLALGDPLRHLQLVSGAQPAPVAGVLASWVNWRRGAAGAVGARAGTLTYK